MNITYRIDWQPVSTAVSYLVSELDNTGETTLGSTTDTEYDVVVDDTQDAAFLVRAWDGEYYSQPVTVVYEAPVTLGTLRNQIRTELKDTVSGKYKWTDTELSQYLKDALQDYEKHFPKPGETTLTLEEGTLSYALPSGLKRITRVCYHAQSGDIYLKAKPFKGGETSSGRDTLYWKLGVLIAPGRARPYQGHYELKNNEIALDFAPLADETLTIEYAGDYALPVFDTIRLDIPSEDLELLKLYAKGLAMVRIETQDANLSRWKEDGRRDDNPIVLSSNRYFNAYNQKIKEKKNGVKFLKVVRA